MIRGPSRKGTPTCSRPVTSLPLVGERRFGGAELDEDPLGVLHEGATDRRERDAVAGADEQRRAREPLERGELLRDG